MFIRRSIHASRVIRASSMLSSRPFSSARGAPGASSRLLLPAAALLSLAAVTAAPALAASPAVDYDQVRKDIAALLSQPSYEDGSLGPVVVRLAWHASGTYDAATGTGGSNGATMRFSQEASHGANQGLEVARVALEPIKRKHPGISYADLWTLAGAVAIEALGGPRIPWRPGRTDAAGPAACPPDGRLPDASQGAAHVRAVFNRMGFREDREIVALVGGGHALGRCHRSRSGYDGPWGNSPTVFSNDFFVQLIEQEWVVKKWDGPKQFVDKATGGIMMLPTDMALLQDEKFGKIVKEFAADEDKFFQEFAAAFGRLLELGVPFEDQAGFITKVKRLFY